MRDGDKQPSARAVSWFSILLLIALLIVSAGKYRAGIVRPDNAADLLIPFCGARAWVDGSNPYDEQILYRRAEAGGVSNLSLYHTDWLPPVYPPSTFVLLAPLAFLSWPVAIHVWELTSDLLFLVSLAALLHLSGLRPRDFRALLLILFCLAFAPPRNAMVMGQNALPATCLVIISASALRLRRNRAAGVLLALALCLKPQDAAMILLFYALIGRWRAVAWSAGVTAAISVLAIIRLQVSPVGWQWLNDWLAWVRRSTLPGGINDPSSLNEFRLLLIHLPVALFTIFSSRWLVFVLSGLISGAIGILGALAIFRRTRSSHVESPDLLSFSAAASFALMATFHRFPDAILLLLPAAWAVSRLGTAGETRARVTLFLLLPFLMNIRDVIIALIHRGVITRQLTEHWWWQCFVSASPAWLILLTTCWLIAILLSDPQEDSPPQIASRL